MVEVPSLHLARVEIDAPAALRTRILGAAPRMVGRDQRASRRSSER